MPIDILAGSPALRGHIETQTPILEIEATWEGGVEEFVERREPHLIYR